MATHESALVQESSLTYVLNNNTGPPLCGQTNPVRSKTFIAVIARSGSCETVRLCSDTQCAGDVSSGTICVMRETNWWVPES